MTLCAVFIISYDGEMEEPKYEDSGGVALTLVAYKSPSKEMFKFVTQILQDAGVDKPLVVESDSSGVSVALVELFLTPSTLSTHRQGDLGKLASNVYVQLREESSTASWSGHTDGRPITQGIYPSN